MSPDLPLRQPRQISGVESSLPLLLTRLEWVLLALVAIAQVVVAMAQGSFWPLVINGLGLGLFAGLGRVHPPQRSTKLWYTAGEFGLIGALSLGGNLPLPIMLFMVLVLRNCSLLQGADRTAVAILALVGAIGLRAHNPLDRHPLIGVPLPRVDMAWVGFILVFGLVILFLNLLVDAALGERQKQAQLAIANDRLRRYALKIEELATVQERNRIARELHDSLGHSLTVFGIHLEAALRLWDSQPDQAKALLQEVKQLNSKTLDEVRASVTALRSDPLQDRSLVTAIWDLRSEFQRSTGIWPEVTIQLAQPLSQELNLAIYRIIQESLTNIRKYAGAKNVTVKIWHSPDRQVQMEVTDDGRGFEPNQNTTGFGLQGMQERTLALAGRWQVIAAPQQGCSIQATFPWDSNRELDSD